MSFLAPLMLLFAVLVVGPIWLHLYGAKRAKIVEFAAVEFLLGSDRKISRAIRLRELLLLILRSAIFVIIPLLVAKPFLNCQAGELSVARGPQGAVLIIDNSVASMYQRGEKPLLTELVERANELHGDLGPEADVAILTTTSDEVPTELSRKHIRHKDQLRGIRPLPVRANTAASLDRAANLLDRSPHAVNRIYLFTPGTADSLASVPQWMDRRPTTEVSIIVPDQLGRLGNAALIDLEIRPNPDAGARGLRIDVTIASYASATETTRELRLSIGGDIVARKEVVVPADGTLKESFTAALGEDARTAQIEVELEGDDGLDIDDRRFAISRARDTVRLLLVNGDPRTTRHADELFYLRAAIERDDAAITSREISADRLESAELGNYDVVVLANVRSPSVAAAAALRDFVEAGGGLLIACGDRVDPDEYNERLGEVLPQDLATVFDATYGRDDDPDNRRSLQLVKFELDHPIFKVFGQQTASVIDASFKKIVLVGPATASTSRQVLARYDSGAAAIIEARQGSGRIILFTSTLDRDWNDLPIHTGYVPLIDQAIRYLGKSGQGESQRGLMARDPAILPVGPNDERLTLLRPDGTRTVIEREMTAGRDHVRFRDTEVPGFYSVTATLRSGEKETRTEASFAVNLEPGVGNLEPMARDAMPGPRETQTADNAPATRRLELWHGLGGLLLLLLLLESALVLRN